MFILYILFCVLQPVIPIFTQNVREAFRCVGFGRKLWLRLYLITRLPIVPIYGGFPVKLKTHIGPLIPYDGSLTPEQLQTKVINIILSLYFKYLTVCLKYVEFGTFKY